MPAMNADIDLPHVLVVDDNLDASEVLALLIEMENFSTATASTLALAREAIARRPPRLIFLDLNLPDGSGMHLLADIKADPRTSDIQVVMLSGMLDPRLKEQARLFGASAFFTKPLAHEQLMAALDAAR
jgi:DNA-binding response OmpR family regulator